MYYTLLMWDPDAINPSYIHMLVINIPHKQTKYGKTVLPYTPPAPPPGTGTHRYITGVFKQERHISMRPFKRDNFDVQSFVQEYDLSLIEHSMFKMKS